MNASQDANGRSTLLWVSSVDGKTPIPIKVNPITGRVLIEFTGTVTWIQPSGTPFVIWQIPKYLATDGYTVGALAGSGYVKLASGVASVVSSIAGSEITQSASYRLVTDTEKTTWNGKQNDLGFTAENSANKGIANGYAGLDATGKVPSSQLPSFVDDVLEFANLAGFPWTGETGKMYIALDTNKVYRWSGSVYVEISGSPWSTDAVTEGATNLYFTTARVLGTLLTGLSTVTNAVITASDSVLSAMGKLQKQITDEITARTTLSSTVSTLSTTVAGKANTVHTHISTDITDWTEATQDSMSPALAHAFHTWGITVTYDDANNRFVIASTGGGSGTAKICYEGFLPWVQIVGRVWLNVSGQTIATASKFKISLSTLPTGANLIVELQKNGTTIGTATIATGATATNGMYIADATTSSAISENDKLEVYVTQVGSTVSGSDLSFQLISA